MGEQPLWSTRAQIFEIDRETKTSWIPCTKQTVSVSFYHDPNRHTYRIISVDGSKAILNSTITSNMTFLKTGPKFVQWSDPKAGTMYGVGFTNEDDLKKFSDTFKQAQASVKSLENKQEKTESVASTTPTKKSVPNGQSKPAERRTSSVNSTASGGSQEETSPQVNGSKPVATSIDAQLKYENDKLKLALAQSSANAKKWETELQNLRNNNARLTTALQESTSNVEEWKKQLLMYQEQNSQLRTRVQELEFLQKESDQSAGNVGLLQSEKKTLRDKVILLESSMEQQVQEIAKMTLQLSELQTLKLSNNDFANQIRDLKFENERLRSATTEFSSKERTLVEQEEKLNELRELFAKLDLHLHELNNTQETLRNKLTV